MSPQEWNATPWWESALLLEGLEKQGVIGDGKDQPQQVGGKRSKPAPTLDLTSAALSNISGFKTRRAG